MDVIVFGLYVLFLLRKEKKFIENVAGYVP